MTSRDRTVFMVVGLLALVAAFWFLILSPKKDDLSSLKDQISTAQTRLDTANMTAQTAAAAKATYAADYKAVASLGKAVPADDDVPSLVFQLQKASVDSKIDFDSIKLTGAVTPAAPAAATTGAQVAGLAAEQNGTTTGSTTATTPTTPATTTAAAGATTTPAAPAVPAATAAAQTAFAGLPPGAAVGAAGIPTMPFEFDFSGPFLRLEKLLKKIDNFTKVKGSLIKVNGRLMTIDSISLTGFPDMTATIHATAFVLPDDQGLMAGATPTTPGAVSVSNPTTPTTTGAPVTPTAAATPAAGVTP